MKIVGIGEYDISNKKDDSIITHALGSCVALIMYCKYHKIAGMAHIVLPESGYSSGYFNNIERPAYFADIVVPKILREFIIGYGCNKSELEVKLVGGADSLNKNDIFQVGKENVDKIKTILRSYNVPYDYTETGGNISRTVKIFVNNGRVDVKKQPMIL